MNDDGLPARQRALLVDFDGVLRHFPGQNELTRASGLPDGAVYAAAFAPERLAAALTGRLSDAAWRAEIAGELALRFPGTRAEEAVRRWSEPAGELDEAVLGLLQRVRERVKVVLVTNATTRLGEDLTRLGLTRAFDAVVSSAELGVAKPDARFFEQALARAKVERSRALFVDDSPRNVAAARALGIPAFQFAGFESLQRELALFAQQDGAHEQP